MPTDTPSTGSSARPPVSTPVKAAPQPEQLYPPGDAGAPQGPENELWAGRTSWKHYTGRLVLWVIALTVVGVAVVALGRRSAAWGGGTSFWVVLALQVVSGIPILGGIALKVLGSRFRLTTQRLFISRGILSQTVDQTELVRVDDVRIHKPVLDRIFGVGSVGVVSTDATDREIMIEGIADPDRVAELIRTQMRALRRKSVFVENI